MDWKRLAAGVVMVLVISVASGGGANEWRNLEAEDASLPTACQDNVLRSDAEAAPLLVQKIAAVKCPTNRIPCTAECANGIATCEICCGRRQTCKATQCSQTKATCQCVDVRQ